MPSGPVFVGTAYVFALVNSRDQWHEVAVQWGHNLTANRRKLLTTDLVFIEIADGLANLSFRKRAIPIIDQFRSSSFVDIVPITSDLIDRAFDLYRARPDKEWGLTDCVSFVVMNDCGLTDALTSDDHFRQAGFNALLYSEPA